MPTGDSYKTTAPAFRVLVNGHKAVAMLDSGSGLSAINHEFATSIKCEVKAWNRGKCQNFDGSTHTPELVLNKVSLEFLDQVIKIDLVVMKGLIPTIILGQDFLMRANLVILDSIFHITTGDDPMLSELRKMANLSHNHMISRAHPVKSVVESQITTAENRIPVSVEQRHERLTRVKELARETIVTDSVVSETSNQDSGGYSTECPSMRSSCPESMYDEEEDEPIPKLRVVEETRFMPFETQTVYLQFPKGTKTRWSYTTEMSPRYLGLSVKTPKRLVDGRQCLFATEVTNHTAIPVVLEKFSKPLKLKQHKRIPERHELIDSSEQELVNELSSICSSVDERSSSSNEMSSEGVTSCRTAQQMVGESVNPHDVYLIGEHLDPNQRQQVLDLLDEYREQFCFPGDKIGQVKVWQHHIHTGDALPVHEPPYRASPKEKVDQLGMLKGMLEQEVVARGYSSWSAPVICVPKRGGGSRFCINYSKLNSVTRDDQYPLPRIDDGLEFMGNHDVFSTLDISAMFWHIPMAPDSIEKTGFVTFEGHYVFLRCPFGLKGAPSSAQRTMNMIFAQENRRILYLYLDDIIVMANGFDQQMARLRQVFERLKEHNLKLNPKKCHFFQKRVSYPRTLD